MVISVDTIFKKEVAFLSDAPADKCFWLHSGKMIANLSQLVEALGTMDSSEFERHVTPHKNDFANWINDVLKDKELSDKIRVLKKT